MKLEIIIDTREKNPWVLESEKDELVIYNATLKTGDYSLKDYETIFAIERKASVSEIAGNLLQGRFYRELERLSQFKYPYLFLEFGIRELYDYPFNNNLNKKVESSIKVRGPYLIKLLNQIPIKYGIHIYFCYNKYYAEYMAISVMKEVIAYENA